MLYVLCLSKALVWSGLTLFPSIPFIHPSIHPSTTYPSTTGPSYYADLPSCHPHYSQYHSFTSSRRSWANVRIFRHTIILSFSFLFPLLLLVLLHLHAPSPPPPAATAYRPLTGLLFLSGCIGYIIYPSVRSHRSQLLPITY